MTSAGYGGAVAGGSRGALLCRYPQGVAQIVQVFQERSALAFEELEATNSREGPIMLTDAFDDFPGATSANSRNASGTAVAGLAARRICD